jgi:hypothetical protein
MYFKFYDCSYGPYEMVMEFLGGKFAVLLTFLARLATSILFKYSLLPYKSLLFIFSVKDSFKSLSKLDIICTGLFFYS